MIKSITFIDPNGFDLPKDVHCDYMYTLPSLRGKTFEFTPKINVIVGKNGSGKTSLLKVLRYLTFCDGQFGTNIKGPSYWELHWNNIFDRGHWHLTKMKSFFRKSTINLRKREDIGHGDEMSDSMSFMQSLGGFRRSKGETATNTIGMMLTYLRGGEEGINKHGDFKSSEVNLDHLDFKKMALTPIENAAKKGSSQSFMWKTMKKYYKDNALEENEENKIHKGLTILMDEPDAGMDIYNVEQVYKIITGMPKGFQMIVVVHNTGLIHRLSKIEGVNFIELTEGYVKKVTEFVEGK